MRNNQAMQNALRDACMVMDYNGYNTMNFEDAGQKQGLYNHLSTLPNWDESKLRLSVTINDAIYKLGSGQRNVIGDMVFKHENLENHTNHASMFFMLSEILRYNLTRNYEFVCDDQFEKLQTYAKEVYNLNIRDNVKPAKLVASVYKKIGMNDEDTKDILDYLSCYAPSTTERTYYISINPLDYLTMSNGNSWNSCQLLVGTSARDYGAGCYGQGCLSLWLDKSTAMLYEEATDYDTLATDINYHYKRGRRLLNYGNNGILIQKGYGDMPNELAISVLKTIYPDGEEVGEYDFNEDVDIYGAHYDDFGCNSYFYNFTENLNIFNFTGISVGSEIHCVGCGELIEYYDGIVNGNQCDNCKKETCRNCGCEMYTEDAILVDWEYYCPDCVQTCDDCGDYFLHDELMEIGGYTYCESCANYNSTVCELCGELIHIDNSHLLDNGLYVCEYCRDDFMDNESDDETE